jgi:hypothetical protein
VTLPPCLPGLAFPRATLALPSPVSSPCYGVDHRHTLPLQRRARESEVLFFQFQSHFRWERERVTAVNALIKQVPTMRAWPKVAMDSLKSHPGLLCFTLLSPAGRPPVKRLYGCFKGGLPAWQAVCGRLLPLWTPHPVRLWSRWPPLFMSNFVYQIMALWFETS